MSASTPSSTRSAADTNPGHELYNLVSTDTDTPRSSLLRRILSAATSSRDTDRPDDGAKLFKRASLVPPNYNPVFTAPPLECVRASRNEWALALVALPDNGIRTELRDMYAIFASMEERPLALEPADVTLFCEWYGRFQDVLEEMFLLEERCLFPWIEGTDELSENERLWEPSTGRIKGELSEAKRMRRKGEIMKRAEEVKECQVLFEGGPVLQGLPLLAKAVEAFVTELLGYLQLKESWLPSLVGKLFKPKDRVRYEKLCWQTAASFSNFEVTVVAATRWMTRAELRRWKSKYFATRGKGMYGKWRSAYLQKHYSIVSTFAELVQASERERVRQMQEHDAARARAQNAPFGVQDYEESDQTSRLSGSCASSWRPSNASSVFSHVPSAC